MKLQLFIIAVAVSVIAKKTTKMLGMIITTSKQMVITYLWCIKMNFTNSELVGLISMTKDRLSDSKNVIKRQEKIIIDHHKYKDDQQIIELSLHTLKQLEEDYKKLIFLKEKLIKQFYSQGGKEVFI